MTNKLKTNGKAIGNNADKFHYIYSCLEAKVQNTVVAYIERDGNVMFYVLRDTNIGSTYVEQSVLQTIGVCRYKTSTCRVRMLGEDSAAISIVVALRPHAAQYGSVPSIHHHRS